MTPRAIVLDANVLMRGVLGRKVDRLLDKFANVRERQNRVHTLVDLPLG